MDSILIIDDDVELCRMLEDYLSPHHIRLTMTHHAADGIDAARSGVYDLIILDVMLPGMDGFDLLRTLRLQSDVSVLLLTARGGDSDRLEGFEAGADDYLPKPFNPRELLARVRAVLRRTKRNAGKTIEAYESDDRLTFDGIVIDLKMRTAYDNNERLELTALEFELMAAFLESPGKVLLREDLVQRVFDRPFHPEDRSLDMYVSRLRRKLDNANSPDSRIRTIRSAGYLFSARAVSD